MKLNWLIVGISLSLSGGCATDRKVYKQHPFVEQILKPRPKYPGKLTNQVCKEYDGDQCKKWHVTQYDLEEVEFRKDANKLNIICNIGGRRFKICLDKPGYCHREFDQSCFLFICGKRHLVKEEYIPAKNHDFLLKANTRCFNREAYSFGEVR